jgi:hypothetical protein
MQYNQNIYDIFNKRKNDININIESLAFDNIDEGLDIMESLMNDIEASSIEMRSTFYMEDLVFEAMMYENFNEEEIGPMLEAAQEGRGEQIKERLRSIWNKIKEWLKAIIEAIKKFFISCKNAVRNAIDKLMGRKKEDKKDDGKDNKPTGSSGNSKPNKNDIEEEPSDGKVHKPDEIITPEKKKEDSIKDIYERRRKVKLNPNYALNGPTKEEPKSEGDAVRRKFTNSNESVELLQYHPIDSAIDKTEKLATICINPNTYKNNESLEALLNKFGVKNLNEVKGHVRSFYIKGEAKKVSITSLNVNELMHVVNNGDDFINYLEKMEKQGSSGLERIVNEVNSHTMGNQQMQILALSVEHGLKVFNMTLQESIACVRREVNDYTRILTHVIGK